MTHDFVDVNVEFAHVEFGPDFDQLSIEASANIAKEEIKKLEKLGKTFCTSVLIDDKHAKKRLAPRDVDPFLRFVSSRLHVDYICYESSLSTYKEKLFDCLLMGHEARVRKLVRRYEQKNGRIACSHDIAIWHLMRLGFIENLDASNVVPLGARVAGEPTPPFKARRVVSILMPSDREPEEKAVSDILQFCSDHSVIDRIERIYIN